MKRAPLLLLLAAAQCAVGVPGVDEDVYACRSDTECRSTHACISGRCQLSGTTACPTVDCASVTCDGRPCGANGVRCAARACACSGNGGPAQASEQACSDQVDNDCDGLTDCADNGCNGQPCGVAGGTCAGSVCVCPAAGGAPQAVESLCSDGLDNDCDGLGDCLDPSCGNVACGLNGRTCVADAGACQCSGNGGVREGSESVCSDLADNDCDGKTDCADETCDAQACRPNGFVCGAMVCACTGNGGTAQPAGETACTDGFDNDCDGLSDCADPSCNAVSCGTGCSCGMGARRETACVDLADNDGDGQQDCADGDCANVVCGLNGLRCSMGTCRCVVDGGTVQMMETLCGDGRDNDCNGVSDCDETACLGQSCGAGGRVCVGTVCTCFVDGGVTEPAELSCTDGLDNDCDGLIDCADTQCARRQCGASAAQVCCGTACRNLSTDSANCGGCGIACVQSCAASSAGGVASGRCNCNGNGQCPLGQTCSANRCACSAANECTTGQTCATSTCRY